MLRSNAYWFIFVSNRMIYLDIQKGEIMSKTKGVVVLGLGILLHFLACKESPLFYNYEAIAEKGYSLPLLLTTSFAYALPGLLVSIIFIVPLITFLSKSQKEKGFFKGFSLRNINTAIYIGLGIRISLYFLQS